MPLKLKFRKPSRSSEKLKLSRSGLAEGRATLFSVMKTLRSSPLVPWSKLMGTMGRSESGTPRARMSSSLLHPWRHLLRSPHPPPRRRRPLHPTRARWSSQVSLLFGTKTWSQPCFKTLGRQASCPSRRHRTEPTPPLSSSPKASSRTWRPRGWTARFSERTSSEFSKTRELQIKTLKSQRKRRNQKLLPQWSKPKWKLKFAFTSLKANVKKAILATKSTFKKLLILGASVANRTYVGIVLIMIIALTTTLARSAKVRFSRP